MDFGEEKTAMEVTDLTTSGVEGHGDERLHTPDSIGSATRDIDVFRSAIGSDHITAASVYIRCLVRQICQFKKHS